MARPSRRCPGCGHEVKREDRERHLSMVCGVTPACPKCGRELRWNTLARHVAACGVAASCHPDRKHRARRLCGPCYLAAGFEQVDRELERRRKERHAAKARDRERSRYATDPRVRERLRRRAERLKGTPTKDRYSPEALARRRAYSKAYYRRNKGLFAAHARAAGLRPETVLERRQKENAWRRATGRVTMSMDEIRALADATMDELRAMRASFYVRIEIEHRERRERVVRDRRLGQEPIPVLHVGHELFDVARAMTAPAWYGEALYDPTGEDARSEAVLALLEGRDPREAAGRFRAVEAGWRSRTTTIADWRL